MGRQAGSARASGLAAASLCLTLVACEPPEIGARTQGAVEPLGTKIEIVDAWVDLHGHVVATFTVSDEDLPVGLAEVLALRPLFALATLKDHPVDGLRAWKSELLTGRQVAPQLPPGGPGTPPGAVLTNARQPGYEEAASLVDLGDGRFRYVFENALAEFDPTETVRVGVWLANAEEPTARTSSTFDFRPSGGPVEQLEVVRDEDCHTCHRLVESPMGATGVRICVTCHTWQHADPDTIDPASTSATAATDPNPLDFGRLIHRIHRGRDLPTLYQSNATVVDPDPLSTTADLPLPFSPKKSPTPLVGKLFSVVGVQSRMAVFGRVVQHTTLDGLTTITQVAGVTFPRDLRDCGVCHDGAEQAYVVTYGISRRTCSGCHPDIWFSDTPITDQSHFPHPGGPRLDDSECLGCHVEATPTQPKVWAPISGPSTAHAPPWKSERYNRPEIEIVSITDLVPTGKPVIRFKLRDRQGFIGPTPRNPAPVFEPASSTTASPVPRRLASLSFRVHGPNSDSGPLAGDFARTPATAISGNAIDLVDSGGSDPEYVYTFTSPIPATATGAWLVSAEARRYLNPTWSNLTTYLAGERVVQLTTYRSLQANNQDHQPLDPGWWGPILTPAWSSTTTYGVGDLATRSSTTYRSLQPGNRNHQPPSVGWWEPIPGWSGTESYGAGELVTESTTYRSLQANNQNHQLLDAAWWEAIPTPPAHYTKDGTGRPDAFIWPYTGETVNETAENPLAWVDTRTGTWPPDAPNRRRKIVGQEKCLRCHGRIEFHGGGARHEVELCLMCHTPDYAARATNLGSTFDGIEERSIHAKVMIHRIHTGGRQGSASLDGIQPFVIGDAFFEGLFPNDLSDCTVCHEGKSYLVESVPPDAPPTIANETGTLLHQGTSTHTTCERTPPVQAACTGCHASGATLAHVAEKTVDGVETCAQCHTKGPLSVEVAHGLAPPSGAVAASFSALMSEVLAPRCGSCHTASATAPPLDSAAAYDALLAGSGQTGVRFVVPGRPEESGLSLRLRDMPPAPDSLLDPADVAAVEAWILNGAPND
jgi:OmcA/MtrC family decaheme c-type cytochrome